MSVPSEVPINQNARTGDLLTTLNCTEALSYQILSITPNTSFLQVDSTSGDLRLSVDAIELDTGTYSISLECTHPSGSNNATLTVLRVEENEFPPTFDEDMPTSASIPENAATATSVIHVLANDGDLGSYGDITYSIPTPGIESTFQIDASTGEVTLSAGLDFEQVPTYQFFVSASNVPSDAGIVLSSSALVMINVVDIDDTSPVFYMSNYERSLLENNAEPINIDLLTTCTDLDTNDSYIRYEFGSTGDRGPFQLDQITGQLSVPADGLDYETTTLYSFEINCFDNSSLNNSGSAQVDISVLPVNEAPPELSPKSIIRSLRESSPVGTVLVSTSAYNATDSDTGPDGIITYTLITDSNEAVISGVLDVDMNTGEVIMVQPLDFDVDGLLSRSQLIAGQYVTLGIRISTCDIFPLPLNNNCPRLLINLFLFPTNEFTPEFSQEEYSLSVLESAGFNEVIGRVTCTDRDLVLGQFSEINFGVASQAVLNAFVIDHLTGDIRVRNSLDYEATTNYGFHLVCNDTKGLENQTFVSIEVIPVNDNVPTFDQNSYEFQVSRSTPANRYTVGRVSATDIDNGFGGDLVYSEEPNTYFRIESDGTVVLVHSIQNVSEDGERFNAIVRDGPEGANTTNTAIAFVVIVFTEGNMNMPQFEAGSRSVEISELLPIGDVVTTVQCSDNETGLNGAIRYLIQGGNTDGVFDIGAISGDITVAAVLTLPLNTTGESYTLHVVCEDLGVPRKSSLATILVRVTQDDSSPPVIGGNNTIFHFVDESTEINTVVIRINATDLDTDSLEFGLENESRPGVFIIDPPSGRVILGAPLDRETVSAYTMTVVVTERRVITGPERSDRAVLTILVRDVNDNHPTCDQSSLATLIPDSLVRGEPVLTLNCFDPDIGVNGNLTYSLLGDFGVLAVDDMGIIYLNNSLESEDRSILVFEVEVSDRGLPVQLMNTYHVTVSISSTNRNVPQILNLPNSISIPESLPLQSVVFTVEAEDPDRGSFGQLTYRILDTSDSSNFMIIPNTGSIIIGTKLDFFEQQVHTLNISVDDMDFFVSEVLVVNVSDVNEFPPICEETLTTATIAEGLPAGQVLSLSLGCTDEDEGPNGEIGFAVLSGDDGGIFALTGEGVITVLETLDFEQEQQYSLLVMVSDGGTPPRSVNATVTVVVQAVNEFAPTFVQSFYAESIPENSTVGSSILTVTATDGDLSTHQDGQVVYSISGQDSVLFTISSSGLLQVAGDLDRENQEVFSFVVTANDQGAPLMSESVIVNITLIDVDDNSPEFTEMFYRTTYDQQEDFVLLVACDDPDAGTNGAVEYSLDPRSSDAEFFQISSSGVVRVNGMLAISRTYSFGVACTGPPPARRFDTAVVIIQAVVNTTINFLPSNAYTLTLDEDTSPIYNALTIVAISSTNTSLTYSLLTDDSEFRLDGSTGILRLVDNLDYEMTQSFALRVQASDNGDPPNLAEALVDILVGNVNDETPIIAMDIPPALNRTEGPTLGIEPLLDMECSDQDDGIFGAVSFRIEEGNELGLFSLSSSGIVSLVGEIDYEIAQSFALEIVCEDGGSPVLSDSVILPVVIIPVNDNPPMFQENTFTKNVEESLLVGARIGSVVATDADLPPHGDIRYSIISLDTTASPTFELAPTTGELTLLRSLDYDEGIRTFSLSVLAEDRGGSEDPDFPVMNGTATVVINVVDVNDNSPVLSRSAYSGSIVEEVDVGAMVILVDNITCTDADSGDNGDISFSIRSTSGDNNAFQIHPDTGVVTSAQNLNFETQSSYSLTVSCVDHGATRLSSEANLFVTVIDLNEFSPRFTNESGYEFHIPESALVGDVIGAIEATDEDAGDAGIVSYSFINSSRAPFSLHPNTGVLTLTDGLDFETQSRQYILQAVASDNAGNSNEATIIVNVLDVDDHLPMFSMSLYLLSVRENAQRDTVVGTVSCTDADNTALGITVVYTMVSSSPFAVDGMTGEILVADQLDLESISRHSVHVVCTDAAGNEERADVTISLLPFNDFTPVFLQSSYNVSVVENNPPGTSILQLRAVDDDTEEYAAITYTIVSGNEAGLFSVDPSSGVLRASGEVDRERAAEHVLEVQAQNVIAPDDESGSSPLSSLAVVFVEVLDVNDNSPVIVPSNPPPVFITESDGPFAFVLQLSCSDADVGLNGTTSFSITSPGSSERFQITGDGVLNTTTLIRTNEVVTVTCSDSGVPASLSTSVDISVNTMSVNDHPPMFDSANYTLRVREDMAVGEIVGCVSATDRDGLDTPDGVIEYSLEFTGSGVSKFGIMESTGCIFVAIALDFDVAMVFEYTVIATDGGVLTLQGNATLVVEIIDAIRDRPMFQNSAYTRMIPETVAVGFLIAQITCIDPDVNDTTTYSILNDPSQFAVDPASGRITTAASLDFESAQSHALDVVCTDSFGLEDMAQVLVTVVPINEFPPTFVSTTVDIEENSIIGREVTTLVWMDSDSGDDGEVAFTIISGNVDSAFSVTPAGTVLVRGELDRESISFYQLNITITDRSVNEPRLTMGQLNVTILDINDNRPVFGEDPYTFGPIEANETLGYSVGSVSCADNDTGSNTQTSFLISPDNGNFTLFSVDGETGEVVVNGDLRNRDLDTITFTVLCVDNGFPPLVGSARVLVRVEETNRYPPEFLNTSYYIAVPEDTAILDETILTISAFDMDTGINGEIRYHLVDTFNGQFFLDERSGELSLLRPLDFEEQSLFSLIAVARDGAVDSSQMLRSSVEITVQVLGVNEHIPVCLNAIYVSVINATSQGSVVDFFCTDSDDGQDGQLRYTIISGNQDHFVVDDDSLLIPTPISQSDGREQFMLRVLVEDLGVPSRSVTVEVVVIYSFDNLAAPVFSQSSYSIQVPELTEVGSVVETLMATDSDPSIQGQISYAVVGSDNFRIDANSGALFVATPLDWETFPFLSFHVIAEDGDPLNPQSDTASVNVSVLNDNDNSPQCDRNFYTAQIPSNASIGTPVLTLNCSDLDQNPLTYTITSETTPYDIDANTGRVSVSGAITEPTYLASVEVSDGGRSVTVVVNVATLFANIEPPTFNVPEYTFSVPEVAPLLTVIGSVQATDVDSATGDLIYSLVEVDFGGFYVNPSTGDLILTSPLDFEVIQSYSLTVQVSDTGSFDGSNVLSSTAIITVRVNNTNDNHPVFSDGGIYGRTVLETTPMDTSILTIICTDNDLVPFGSPSISSDGFNGVPFSLQEVSMGEAEVVVSESLSGPNPYFVNVTCRDGGDLRVEGQVFLFVPEPLAPTFSEPVYEWVVSELSPTGTTFASVQAESNDDSAISFSISDGNNDDIFHIDSSSGVISLVTTLDYETQRRHGLIVRVVDTSNRESNVLLLVQVTDANDEVPLIPPSALLSVTQNQVPGHPVGTVECVDADANINNTVFNYTFSPASDQFSIDEFGVIRLEAGLDNTPAYVIPVVCFDIRDTTVNSTGIVTIEVEFVNLHQPVFSLPFFNFSIREDLAVLSLLGNPVTATDDDIGSFSELMYDIEGEQDQFFIESATGRVGLLTSLDREIQDSHTITVIAVDGGPSATDGSRRTGSTTVMVAVEDANDNAPIPSQLSYVQAIATNHTVRSPVLSVSCSDPDQGSNGAISYSLSSVENFVIQQDGTILLAQEQPNQAVYSFFAICEDEGSQPLSSSALVTVVVNFLALSAPVFSQDAYMETILENTTVTTPVLTVQATPSDASITVVYSIASGNERESFFIDSLTGEVSVRNPLDAREQQSYTLGIEAGNSGSAQLFSLATVSIFVEDINDNSPSFRSQFSTGVVPESSILLTPVVSVMCEDSDVNSDISYSITGGLSDPPTFNITQGGQIAVAGELDYEFLATHSLEITCSDGGPEPRTAVATVRISVSPVNEFTPRFIRTEYTFTATENDFGAYIGKIEATDMDAGTHGSITYLLQDPGDLSVIFVDPTSGDVNVSSNLDYEFRPFWNLTVIARDGGGLQESISLNIEIVNVNDVFPVIAPEAATVSIPVDREAGFPVQSYECADADGSDTSISITSGNSMGYFELDTDTRVLYWTGGASDLLSNSVVSLTLHCVDADAIEQFADSIIAVSIVVTDAIPPAFTQEVYSVSVREDTPVNTTVLTVLAYADGMNTVNYTLLSLPESFPFVISSLEGNITLVRTLNREEEDTHSFVVSATDEVTGAIGLSRVVITTIDINDNPPVISPATQAISIAEDFTAFTAPLAVFSCTDSDTGPNDDTSFSITSGNVMDVFRIDTSGRVYLAQPLDFELITSYTLNITCLDSLDDPLADTAVLLVSVLGFNEHPPVFTNSTYVFSVSELAPIGEEIGTVLATDGDAGPDGVVTYTVLGGSDTFVVHGSSGEISLAASLNFELQSRYDIAIEARDGSLDGTLRMASTADVAIVVTPTNEHTPTCRNAIYTTIVNATSQGKVVDFFCTDADGGRDGRLVYSIVSGNEDDYFSAELDSILIPTPISQSDGREQFMLRVLVEDLGVPSRSVTVEVVVIYSFDNLAAPVFSQSSYSIQVPELTEVGSVVETLMATDSDPSIQGQISYAVVGSDNFRIDANSGALFVATPLDWETFPFLSFHVIAEDGDPLNPQSDTASVNVSVLNDNDNSPQCDRNFYTAQIPSNASIGTPVLTLNCSDLDQNPLTYTITSEVNAYNVDPNTGVVSVSGPLEESIALFSVRVSGDDAENINITVTITTLFSNQQPPLFDRDEYTFSITESAAILTTVGSVVATDIDSGVGGLSYSSADSSVGEFSVNPSTGDIILSAPLDYEDVTQYRFDVLVMDTGSYDSSNVLSSTTTITVDILNANDNRPVFSNGGIYGSTIPEVTATGTIILNISCTDNDDPSFGSPSISSDGFDDLPFEMVPVGLGEVEVRVSSILSGNMTYLVNVTCTDEGGDSVEGLVFIVIPEPQAPVFTQTLYEWDVSELALIGESFSDIQAQSDDGSTVSYSITGGNGDDIFYIDPSSGEVILVASLDFEDQPQHALIVRVMDGAARQSTVLFLVHVVNANDEVPLTPPFSLFRITQNDVPGHIVGAVECVDADANLNTTIFNYTFSPASDQFSIDEFGVIRLEAELDNTPAYVIPVVCFDIRDTTVNSTGIVTIEVDFVNLHQPVFTLPSFRFSVTEDLEVLSLLGNPVTATDDDVGSFSELMYDIEGEQDQFFIESATGRVGLLTSLDREVQDSHMITVIAVDGGPSATDGSRRTGSTTVMVTVEDANDNAPIPSQLSYVQAIATNHTVLSPVLSVSCSDPDQGSNGAISYYLSSNEYFVIQQDGTILLAQEQPNQAMYSFFVICEDGGSQPLNASALVTVVVNFLALNAPVFSEDIYMATILENITVTTPVLTVQATPSDTSITVVYSIASGNERENFFIDTDTGVISVRNALDAREEQYYTLVVRAGNAGSDQLHSFATVSIFVGDINDNSPSFLSQFYTRTVPESSVLLTPVVSVVCIDSDVNSDISYSITGGLSDSPAFNITQGGQIAVAGELDYERTFAYSLVVTCSDGGLEPRTATTTVRIDISPVNEFRPRFSRPRYTFAATENDFGANIGRIEATDLDMGPHGAIIYLLNDPGNFSVVFVDPTSGNVHVSNNLDYEFRQFWNLTVTASDGGGLEQSVSLNIEVVNVNDVLPVIVPETGVHSVAFDELPDTPLQPYECTDADGSTTTLSILSGNEQGYFGLVGNVVVWTGQTAAANLTANLVTSFTVRCQDDSATEQFVDSIVAVSIVVTDAVPPVFTQAVYSMSVPEDTPISSTILTVLASANNTLNYSLLSLPSRFPFDIDPVEGSVSLVRPLDREAVDMFSFFATATDTITGAVGVSRVDISVTDINDNRPVITPVDQSIMLPEDHPLSVSFAQFDCTDVDSNNNGRVLYEIPNGGSTFSIDGNGHVSLSQPLDFESLTSYALEVVCLDGADVPLNDSATLLVAVGGVNEYPPIFSNSTYRFSVSEYARTGDSVGYVSASDLDAGLDGEISYSVLSGSGLGFFTLGQSGSIATSILPLNATRAQSLELSVRATDGGGQHADTVVVVTVQDINEPPQFSDSGNYFVSTTTDLSPGETLLQFTCYDSDVLGSRNSELNLEISNLPSDISLLLQTTEREGALDASLVSDSSAVLAGSYALSVTCTDRGNPPISYTTSITVRVDTLNTPPVFVGDIFASYVIAEDSIPGTHLFSVNATDAETDVIYSITGGTGLGTFQVDRATGAVTTVLFLDYETTALYSLQIEASDLSPTNQMSTSLMTTVLVRNVNDINPRLFPEAQSQAINLEEDTDAGSTVPLAEYTCSDPDGGEPPTITISSLDSFFPFDITSLGEVVLRMAVDYEVLTIHTIIVTCTDMELRSGEGTMRQTSVSLIINVQPVNIHAPVFTSELSFEISEGASFGDRVGTLVATDGDGRGQITFSSTSERDTFLVDSNGNITLVSGLDHETRVEYMLEVVASDNDHAPQVEPRTAEETVVVRVTDENDNHPTCDMNVLSVHFETGSYSDPSLYLVQLNCSDGDSGLNSLLHYSFVEDSLPNLPEGSFVLNETSGELRFQGNIDVSGSHVLEVIIEDSGTPSLNSIVMIGVQVETANETRPRFNRTMFNTDIYESAFSPTVIFRGEEIMNEFINPLEDRVVFSLQPNVDNNGAFIIDSDTASITLVDSELLDFEQTMQYTLTIEAIVNSEPADFAFVFINILDSNDNAPRFPRSIYNGSVPENEPPGTPILRVDASDRDSGDNSLIRYTIQGDRSLAFSIDPDNGTITTTRRFDRETFSRYTIVVLATDMGAPPMTGITTVTVDVLDSNDSPPSFVNDVYIVSITNIIQPGDTIVTLRVTDEDEVGDLSLDINDQDSREAFVVESTGELRLRSTGLPRPYRSRYNFTVIASDGVATDEATVIISVVSVTTDIVFFKENVPGEEYHAREFLAKTFDISSEASYDITQGDLFDEFEIESGGNLTVRGTLDRENTSHYDLTILVVDDMTSVNIELLVAVIVLDQNDNVPMLDSTVYRFNVSEGPYEDDTIFGSVNATDLDEPGTGGATIDYTLITPFDEFAIDSSTGELYLKAGTILDYETGTNFTFLVQARDFGEPNPLDSSALVIVSIDDINDNDPEFVPLIVQEYLVLLPPSADNKIPPNTRLNKIIALFPFGIMSEVTTIAVTDPDPSSPITATLEGGQGEKIKFGIANPGSSELELVTIDEVEKEDSPTFLQLVLRDEPIDEEDNPVIRNITFVSDDDFLVPTTEKVNPDVPPFFQTIAGIAVIVVICVLILIFAACLVFLLCYVARRRDKDPLQDTYVNSSVVSHLLDLGEGPEPVVVVRGRVNIIIYLRDTINCVT